MTGPAIVIRLAIEADPEVFVDTIDDGERDRLEDWLDQHPRQRNLIRLALELANERRVA